MVFNYFFARSIRLRENVGTRKWLLFFSIAANVLFLGYFKYANFFIDTVNTVFQSELHLTIIILPLAISFFTIQQISYLVDSYRLEITGHNFIKYCLFVTYFPKFIAGPIMRFKEFIPQLAGKTPFPVWDFGVYNYIIEEEVPSIDDENAKIRWYWDASHYSKEVGDLILDKIFGMTSDDDNIPDNFGVLLTSENIEQHLQQVRQDRDLYRKTHP